MSVYIYIYILVRVGGGTGLIRLLWQKFLTYYNAKLTAKLIRSQTSGEMKLISVSLPITFTSVCHLWIDFIHVLSKLTT